MGAEGTFRRSAWALFDTRLPDWLQLAGRSRRPPRNAGNAFVSYANGITYARVLSSVRLCQRSANFDPLGVSEN
jgi:CRISPR-associated protein Cas1